MLIYLSNQDRTKIKGIKSTTLQKINWDEKDLENLISVNITRLIPENQLMVLFQERPFDEAADIYALDKKGELYLCSKRTVSSLVGGFRGEGRWKGRDIMKTITAIEFRQHLDEYLTRVQEEEIVITLDDGRLVLLFSVEPEDLADEVIENDPRFADLIATRRENYQQTGGVPFATVRQKLVDELVQDLNHADPRVRQEAIRHLAELGELVPKVNNPEA